MIEKFNRQQAMFGLLRVLLSILIFTATYWFFKTTITYFCDRFHIQTSPRFTAIAAFLSTAAIAVSGFRRWQNGMGHFTMAEANIPSFPDSSFCANLSEKELLQSATTTYLITTFFLAAPIQMMKAYGHFRIRIPDEHGLETKMLALLTTIHQVNKWQNFTDYPGNERELIFLINMGKVEYSPQKGRIKSGS